MKETIPAFFVFTILILLSPIGINKSFGQNYNIDSLEIALNVSEGHEKIPYYYALTEYYIYSSPGKTIRLANEFLILAEKYDSTSIIEYCYQILGEAYYFQEKYETSLMY